MGTIYKNTGFLIWSGGISMVHSLLVWAIVARYLGQSAFGRFTLIMAIYLVFFNLCTLGLGPLIVREVAGDGRGKGQFLGATALILALSGVLCGGFMIATGLVVSVDSEVLWPLAVLSLSLLPTALISGCESLLIADERGWLIAAVNTGESVLKAIICWGLVSLGFGLSAVCASFVGLRVGALATYLLQMRHHSLPLAWPSRAVLRQVMSQGPSFLFITLAAGVHWQLGTMLLAKLQSQTEVALYGAASRLLIPWTLVCTSYAAAVNPRVCQLAAQSLSDLGAFVAQTMSTLLALVLPLAAGTSLVATPALRLLFGPGYESAVLPLRLLIWSLVPLSLVVLLAKSLVATHRQRVDLWANVLAVGVNLALNLWLIPSHGVVGVALAQLASTLVLCAVEVIYVSWTLYPIRLGHIAGRLAVATAAMAGLVSLVGVTKVWLMVPVGIVSYVSCLLMLGWRPVLQAGRQGRDMSGEVAV